MVRQGKFRHNVVVTGVNDGTKQVSKDAWNDDLNVAGMFGHTATTLTIATGSITPINDMHKIDGEGASADDLTTIDNTNTAEFDEMWLLGGAQVITIKNSGNIVTLTGLDVVLSTTIPTKLIRIGTSWYEVGASGGGIFPDTTFAVQDDGDNTKQMLVSLGGASAGFDTTLTFIQTADRAITFPDASTVLAGLSIANAYGDFLQTFKDNKFKINSPDDADGVIFVNSDQTADRNLTIPVLTGDDTLVTTGLAQTFTATNTFAGIIHTGRHQYDKGADVASASEITLGADGNVFDITGTTTINTITPTNWQAGSVVILQFDGALTVTHNSGGTNDILLAGATNFTTATGNTLTLFFNGTDWIETARNVSSGGADTPWTSNHDFDTFYFDMQNQSAPSNPSADNSRFYTKVIDSNNDGFFVKVKKNGGFVEVQIA